MCGVWLKRVQVLLGARVCSKVLLGALGVLLGALGELLGVCGPPGGLGTLGVFLAAPGDPHKQRRVVTGQKVQ